MSGLGNRYSFWKSKLTLGIFAILAFLQVGPRFVDIPSVVTLIAMPITLIHSMTLSRAITAIPVNVPYLGTAGLLLTTYIFSAVLGYIIHSRSGSSI